MYGNSPCKSQGQLLNFSYNSFLARLFLRVVFVFNGLPLFLFHDELVTLLKLNSHPFFSKLYHLTDGSVYPTPATIILGKHHLSTDFESKGLLCDI